MTKVLADIKKLNPFQGPLFHYIAGLFIFIGFDQISKFFSAFVKTDSLFGISIERILNHGFIFGLEVESFSFMESFFIIFVFSVGILSYVSFLYFLPRTFNNTKWGLTLIFSGAFSNMIDKIVHTNVVDFIQIHLGTSSLYINFADIIQTIGWFFILYDLIVLRKVIWRTMEKRKAFIVLKKDQNEFIVYNVWLVVCAIFFMALIGSEFLYKMYGASSAEQARIVDLFPRYSIYMILAFLIPVCVLVVYLSNKIYGPIYAFEKYLKSLINNEPPYEFKLREKDQFKHLEKIAKDLKDKMGK